MGKSIWTLLAAVLLLAGHLPAQPSPGTRPWSGDYGTRDADRSVNAPDAPPPFLDQDKDDDEKRRWWWPFGGGNDSDSDEPGLDPEIPVLPPAEIELPEVGEARTSNEREEWSGNARWWWSVVGPRKKNPADQYLYAMELDDKNKRRGARRAYRKIAQFWPESPEAPKAQLRYAEMLAQGEYYVAAFDAYQFLVDRYAGSFPYDEVLQRQLELARKVEEVRVGKFLILPGVRSPDQAIPLYRQIITNAPQWEKSSESQYRIGEIYHDQKSLLKAIAAYNQCVTKYPGSPFSEKAAFAKAECMYVLADKSPNDDTAAENAWATLTLYLNQYPQSENSARAFELMQNMRRRLARSFYNKARYYDKIAKNERAALIAYRALIEEFPESEWTNVAKSRIDTLSRKID